METTLAEEWEYSTELPFDFDLIPIIERDLDEITHYHVYHYWSNQDLRKTKIYLFNLSFDKENYSREALQHAINEFLNNKVRHGSLKVKGCVLSTL